jgi:hypothetical protein
MHHNILVVVITIIIIIIIIHASRCPASDPRACARTRAHGGLIGKQDALPTYHSHAHIRLYY